MATKKSDDNKGKKGATTLTITPPNIQKLSIRIKGTSPYVQNKFSAKAKAEIEDNHRAGSTSRKGKKKAPRQFEEEYEQAKHIDAEGRVGIPAPAFRNAMIDACRTCGFKMTHAKMGVFIEPDTSDAEDDTPLVFIDGEPRPHKGMVRNKTGVCDIRMRPMWDKWSAVVRVTFDGDMFTASDVLNLMARVGWQVGIGEGRHFSKDSAGQGWGKFEVAEVVEEKEEAVN